MSTSGTKNLLPTDLDWVHELARNELNPEAANIFNTVNQFDPKQVVEESTIDFLEELRELFTAYVRTFNGYSESNQKFSEVKVFGISNTPADFMIFRNNVKLVFANTAHGIINATFTQHNRSETAVGALNESVKQSHDIIAQMGPFMDISWTYQGEKINPSRVVKYFMVEFVKSSRIAKKGSANQLLLQQIKTLLKDQGIDL